MQIANQDEKSQGHKEGSEAFAVMSDNFLALSFDKAVSAFENVLQGAGLVHREPGAYQEEQQPPETETPEAAWPRHW